VAEENDRIRDPFLDLRATDDVVGDPLPRHDAVGTRLDALGLEFIGHVVHPHRENVKAAANEIDLLGTGVAERIEEETEGDKRRNFLHGTR
jgi:hypothetical protein